MNFRPRFSIRTLLVLVTLVGLYFGCWEVTKRFGLKPLGRFTDVKDAIGNAPLTMRPVAPFDSSPAPFVISREDYRQLQLPLPPPAIKVVTISPRQLFMQVREYHVWFFGYTAKLPIEREMGTVTQPQPPVFY